MLADVYFDAAQQHPQQRQTETKPVFANDSFELKLLSVRPLLYILVIAILTLSLFSVSEERSEALVHSPLPLTIAKIAEPVARLSLPARAALYRQNLLAD
jgi:hypothetical protein